MADAHLTIGELAERTGVATSALRYWEEQGLVPAPVRVSGQRRYPESAVTLVGMILLLRDTGFSLREVKDFLVPRTGAVGGWRTLMRRKLDDLDEQIAKAQVVRDVVSHALGCPHDDITACPSFGRAVDGRLAGKPLEDTLDHRTRPTRPQAVL